MVEDNEKEVDKIKNDLSKDEKPETEIKKEISLEDKLT